MYYNILFLNFFLLKMILLIKSNKNSLSINTLNKNLSPIYQCIEAGCRQV